GEGARVLYEFIWNELCDWYIELAKPRLYGKHGEDSRYVAQYVLWYVLKGALELLHPYMPFITEEIWQNLPHEGDTIMLAPWPHPSGLTSPTAEKTMSTVMALITEIRTMRSEKQVPPGRKITAICQASQEVQEILAESAQDIMNLAGLEKLSLEDVGQNPTKALSSVVEGISIFLPLADLVDLDEELKRIKKDLEGTQRELQRAEDKLKNEGFITKAPPHVIEKEKEKLESYRSTMEQLQALLQEMQR
ncbi:MAG TPA: valine--tRNA ligase, partial [Firmicutes bacterium]|nr:valine--tRNA ligase [Bacillota bacterium]